MTPLETFARQLPSTTSSAVSSIPPGSTLGVLGTGQLGRMFAQAAHRMNYRVHAYGPDEDGIEDSPCGRVAEKTVYGRWDDAVRLRAFASDVDVITFEFENVPKSAAEICALSHRPVRPSGQVLHICQNRFREKQFLKKNGFPIGKLRFLTRREELGDALAEIGVPAVLKTAEFGYDGQGQATIQTAGEAPAVWDRLFMGRTPPRDGDDPIAVLEAFVAFEAEVSVVAARGVDGDAANFGVFENVHRDHILDVTIHPARLPEETARQATKIASDVLAALDVVGVLCVEFFVCRNGSERTLLINELAPRTHNSGHLTIEACATSQFEQQVRAICGLPLGPTQFCSPAAMANLIGHLWFDAEGKVREPDFALLQSVPGVALHLYEKKKPMPRRKMGHLTALGATPEEARERVLQARRLLQPHS